MRSTIASSRAAVLAARLAAQVRGSVHLPGEPAYEEACRIWNAMIEHRPALVMRPAESADIAAAIALAKDNHLPLSVRGGGHNVAGAALSDGGVTIDMSQKRAIVVDPHTRIVRVEAGATWKDVDAATQPHGLVVPGGIISATGVAGLTLGAGFGWTSRKFGFTADNLLSAEVVTTDGKTRHVSADENADLFWALRGGGGNFAVVTSFEFRAHPHGQQALCGMVVHPFDRASEVMRVYRKVTALAPDELTCLLVLRRAPPAPFIPKEFHGKPMAAIAAHWTGDPDGGEEAMRPIKELTQPIADTIARQEFTAFQAFLDGGQPFGRRYYWKSNDIAEVTDDLIATLNDRAARIGSPFSAILMMHMAGRPAAMPVEASAVGIRHSNHTLVFQSAWLEQAEDAQQIAWARDSLSAVRPFSSGATYVNFITEDDAEMRVRAAYGPELYERLRRVKRDYDPDNVLRGNLNIPPA